MLVNERDREKDRQRVCVCVCVCKRERERGSVDVCVRVWEWERERMMIFLQTGEVIKSAAVLCVLAGWERERDIKERERDKRERERERERERRESVCVCEWERVSEWVCVLDFLQNMCVSLSFFHPNLFRVLWHSLSVADQRRGPKEAFDEICKILFKNFNFSSFLSKSREQY